MATEEGHEGRVSDTVVKKQKREIPTDVYGEEILSYFPARQVQTLKLVSKDWLQLITSPHFVRLHHFRAYPTRIRIIVTFRSSKIYEYNNYDDEQIKIIPYPPQFSGSNIIIMGSADGLICMFGPSTFDKKGAQARVLFNPSTGKCLHLWPHSPQKIVFRYYWFGKSVDGEYVLVMGMGKYMGPASTKFGVYKLTSSGLKCVHSIIVDLRGRSSFGIPAKGTLVNGVVHWPIRRKNDDERSRYFILAYDIYENRYWEISPPAQCDFRLGVTVDGCLFTIVKNMVDRVFEMWVMKELWTKSANIERFDVDSTALLSPLGFLPNGDLILDFGKKKLLTYSFDSNLATRLMEYDRRRFSAIMCADTLVSPSIPDW